MTNNIKENRPLNDLDRLILLVLRLERKIELVSMKISSESLSGDPQVVKLSKKLDEG